MKFALPGVVALGLFARLLWFCYDPSLWNDEASLAWNIIKYDFSKIAVTPLDDLQAAPPGYLLVEKVFGGWGNYSELSLRLFSLLCGVAALLLFVKLSKQVLTGVGRLAAVALCSLSAPLIYHSGEVKQYETEVLATVVALWLALTLRERISLRQAVGAGVAAMLCVAFSNAAIFVLAGVFAVLLGHYLLEKKNAEAGRVAVTVALFSTAFLLYYFLLLQRNPNVQALKDGWGDHFAPLPVSRSGIVWYVRTGFFTLVDPLGISLDVSLPFLPARRAIRYLMAFSYPGVLLLVLGVVVFARRDRLIGAIVMAGLVTTFLASLLRQYPLNERLILFLAPMAYLLIGKAVELTSGEQANSQATPQKVWEMTTRFFSSGFFTLRVKPDQSNLPGSRQVRLVTRGLAVWLLGYVLFNFTVKLAEPKLFGGLEKYSQMREAIHFVNQHKQPTDPVYLMWNMGRFYDYYNYREQLNWVTVRGTDPRNEAHSKNEVAQHVVDQVQAQLAGSKRSWFLFQDLFSPVHYRDPKGTMHELQVPTAVLYENYMILEDKPHLTQTYTGHAATAYLVEQSN